MIRNLLSTSSAPLLGHAALVTSFLLGSGTRSAGADYAKDLRPPPPELPLRLAMPVSEAAAPADPVFPNEQRNLSGYVTPLRPRIVSALQAQHLIQQGRMSPAALGTVFDEKHVIFVSWDQRGLLLERSAFRPPNASHSAAIALRSRIQATTGQDNSVTHTLFQHATIISFLPDSAKGVSDYVRILPAAFGDPRGVPGRNWQSLEFLLSPNSFVEVPPICVSATRLIPVPDHVYRAFVLRAHDLDAMQTRYFVLGSRDRAPGIENCIGALKGVAHYLPKPIGEPATPRTFTLRGEEATNYIAHEILHRGGISSNGHNRYERDEDIFLAEAFLRSSDAPPLSWYSLTPRR